MEFFAISLLSISVAIVAAMTWRARRPLQTVSPEPRQYAVPVVWAYSRLISKIMTDSQASKYWAIKETVQGAYLIAELEYTDIFENKEIKCDAIVNFDLVETGTSAESGTTIRWSCQFKHWCDTETVKRICQFVDDNVSEWLKASAEPTTEAISEATTSKRSRPDPKADSNPAPSGVPSGAREERQSKSDDASAPAKPGAQAYFAKVLLPEQLKELRSQVLLSRSLEHQNTVESKLPRPMAFSRLLKRLCAQGNEQGQTQWTIVASALNECIVAEMVHGISDRAQHSSYPCTYPCKASVVIDFVEEEKMTKIICHYNFNNSCPHVNSEMQLTNEWIHMVTWKA